MSFLLFNSLFTFKFILDISSSTGRIWLKANHNHSKNFSSTTALGLEFKNKRMPIELKFSGNLEKCDPKNTKVTIIGRLEYLKKLSFEKIKIKLEPRVSEEIYLTAVTSLHPSPIDSCPLYLNRAVVVALPTEISRNNTPSRAHSIAKIISSSSDSSTKDEFIVIICEKSDIFASACAVARSFPLYSRKSNKQMGKVDNENVWKEPIVTVEFIIISRIGENLNITDQILNEDELLLLENSAFAVRNTARIVDIPCSEMHTDQFVQECRNIAEKLGTKLSIIRGEELKANGLGGIYAVGKAAEYPPALVVLSHRPLGAKKNIAWVGKGIVFDTGGLSIKDKIGMCSMKRDCGGAAAILNAFYLAVKGGFKENLHAVLCIAENAVGPLATRPDDILTMYSQKTVEINNTDAEGRLVLGDGVFYAREDLHADIIVDMATLTGAQGITTGKYHAAILTNSEKWENASIKAGKISGDLVFPIVFAPEFHFSEFSSSIADMKNSVANRSNAQSSCAGLFIFSHLGFNYNGIWLHVDIASPSEVGDRATGYGVAFLNSLFGNLSSNSMLKALSPWEDGSFEKVGI